MSNKSTMRSVIYDFITDAVGKIEIEQNRTPHTALSTSVAEIMRDSIRVAIVMKYQSADNRALVHYLNSEFRTYGSLLKPELERITNQILRMDWARKIHNDYKIDNFGRHLSFGQICGVHQHLNSNRFKDFYGFIKHQMADLLALNSRLMRRPNRARMHLSYGRYIIDKNLEIEVSKINGNGNRVCITAETSASKSMSYALANEQGKTYLGALYNILSRCKHVKITQLGPLQFTIEPINVGKFSAAVPKAATVEMKSPLDIPEIADPTLALARHIEKLDASIKRNEERRAAILNEAKTINDQNIVDRSNIEVLKNAYNILINSQ